MTKSERQIHAPGSRTEEAAREVNTEREGEGDREGKRGGGDQRGRQ